ncbi:major facilitator superfamily domain-containing protein [Fusarium flagelliforme]|uniref:major facilitator superfamily domain-containing protein n=1 Tax=Fusarium flagelliforme TaxID=2675880 RepID=UPI001E8EBD63|nr:major facilitator superfamily domain-containing protein [Fusarium flagelliforme]KAH7189574.1 major facilitator superfamily domain-containing protein [Fusarium flagelliforme]
MAEISNYDHQTSSPETQQIIRRINATYDWTGPSDPDNPRNFSPTVKILSIASITSLAWASCFAGAIYAPAQTSVGKEFHQGRLESVLPLSLYNLGMACGPLVGAPLSETYGRKTVYVATTPIFLVFLLGSGFARDITALCVCRFFAGMFASPNVNNTSATIMDYCAPQYRGAALGIYYSIPSLGAAVGPLVGGFVERGLGWRWTQWIAVIVTCALYIPVLFTKETYKKVVLKRRAIKMGMGDGSSQQTSVSKTIRHFFTVLILRPLHMLFTEPIVTLVSLYNGFIFGLLYTFIISVPWIFRNYYDFGKTGESLSYLGITLGTLLACAPFVLIDFSYYQKRLIRWNQTHDTALPPENRLISSMIGSFLLPASLLIAGWTAEYRLHYILPIIFQGMTMLACLLIYAGVNLFMLDAYGPLYGASASGAMMLSRYSLSFAFPLFALQMFEKMGAGWATTLLAGCTLLMAPIPWCFYVYGERIRGRSRYESSS